MGSDFTFSDLDGVEIEDYTFKIVKESDMVDGADCWIIEATPKSNDIIKETGYNNKQLSTLSSSTFGSTTTLNTQQDRIFYLGLSGNVAFSDVVLKFDTSHKRGKRFPFSNPLLKGYLQSPQGN